MAVAKMNRSADAHRDLSAAALRLRGKMETGDYDVFMCYNSRDKEQVMAIGERLKSLGILPWLDIRDIRPGARFQTELQKQLKSVKAAAIFFGPARLGAASGERGYCVGGQAVKVGRDQAGQGEGVGVGGVLGVRDRDDVQARGGGGAEAVG